MNYDRKHLENSKIELENSWKTPGFFFLPKEWEPCTTSIVIYTLRRILAMVYMRDVHETPEPVSWNYVVDASLTASANMRRFM